VARGSKTDPVRCAEIAAVGLLISDVLTIAGHPVPAEFLPPQRDAGVMRDFAYRVSYCDHAQIAALMDFIRTLPAASPDPAPPAGTDRKVYAHPDAGHFATVFDGLMRNRGFGPRDLPFQGMPGNGRPGMTKGCRTSIGHARQQRLTAQSANSQV
jgi:hypothetical protein